jgi:hypothetical protein
MSSISFGSDRIGQELFDFIREVVTLAVKGSLAISGAQDWKLLLYRCTNYRENRGVFRA